MELSELGRVLHEQHFRILVSICGLENRVTGAQAARPFDPSDPEERLLLQRLVAELDEIIDHNAFEEVILFPLLDDDDNELAIHLTHEHVVIGPKTLNLRALAAGFLAATCDQDDWERFRTDALELVALMMTHLQKEEVTIVQRLGCILDPETDLRLAREIAVGTLRGPADTDDDGSVKATTGDEAARSRLAGERSDAGPPQRRACAFDLVQRLTARRRSTALPRSGAPLR